MSDLEEFRNMLRRAGVEYEEEREEVQIIIVAGTRLYFSHGSLVEVKNY